MAVRSITKAKVFVDTNVLLAAFATGGVCNRIWNHAIEGSFAPVISTQVIEEFSRNAMRVVRAPHDQVERAVSLLRRVCRVVQAPDNPPRLCRDRDDDGILAAARSAKCAILVTGDKDLLSTPPPEGLRIMNPAEFLMNLEPRNPT